MKTLRLLIVLNGKWESLPAKIGEVKYWFKDLVNLEIDVKTSEYKDIPFVLYDRPERKRYGVNYTWLDANITPIASGYDMWAFGIETKEWGLNNSARGYCTGGTPIGIQVCADEKEMIWDGTGKLIGNAFVVRLIHEILHALYIVSKQKDRVHELIGETNEKLSQEILKDIKFQDTRTILQVIVDFLKAWGFDYKVANDTIEPIKPILVEKVEKPESKYKWGNPKEVRHSCRVIMDEYKLSWKEKDLLCACIQQESGFDTRAIGKPNKNGTRDFGLCQYNDGKNKQGIAYWIGQGADFKDIDEALDDPEKNVRVMVREYKKGNLKYWSSFSTGAYKRYL